MGKGRRRTPSHTHPGARARAATTASRQGFGRTSTLLAALALIAAGAWAYSTSFAGVFVLDDGLAIVDNPHIKTLWPLTEAMSAPAEATVSGRPIASLTLALNYALAPPDARDVMAPGGPTASPSAGERFYRNVWGYHALNLAIHIGAALVLFGTVRRTLVRKELHAHSTPLALVVALLWVVHPLQTQAVTYVVQRVESLMGLFYLLTLYCAIRAADDHGPPEGGHYDGMNRSADATYVVSAFRRTFWTVAAIAFCALGMATKEVMVTAPITVLLWDLTFDVEPRRRLRLYAGLAATWVILILLVVFEHRPQSVGFDLGWSWWSYLTTQAAVIAHYLRLAIVPLPLVFDYGWPKASSLASVWPHALFVGVLVGATAVALVKRHPLGFLGAWVFLILAPTSSVLPIATEVAAEHRMYLPVAAIIVAVVIGAYTIGRCVPASRRQHLVAITLSVSVGTVAVTFAELTRARNRDYWSDEALWIDTIAKRPSNGRARVAYGIDLLAAGRYADAERQLLTAVSLNESDGRAHMNLGSALAAQGKLSEGIEHLERAIALSPQLNEAYGLLGEAYSGAGNQRLAARYFQRALAVLPDNPFLLNRVAWLLATTPDDAIRNGAKAVELAERAVRTGGGENPVFLDTLAAAYAEQNRFDDAVASTRQALDRARAQNQSRFIPELERHLALYSAGRRLRVP
jgi:Tfp pilus assembly protein PilF